MYHSTCVEKIIVLPYFVHVYVELPDVKSSDDGDVDDDAVPEASCLVSMDHGQIFL